MLIQTTITKFAFIFPLLGGITLIVCWILAIYIDWQKIQHESGRKLAPRYLSVAINNRKNKPYKLILIGITIFGICLILTTIFQLEIINKYDLNFTYLSLLKYAIIAALFGFLVTFIPLSYGQSKSQILSAVLHIFIAIAWAFFTALYVHEATYLTMHLFLDGHSSIDFLELRYILTKFTIFGGYLIFLTLPFGMLAHRKLLGTQGYAKGKLKINKDNIFIWSLLPFSLGITQMIVGFSLFLNVMLCAFELAML